MPGSPFYDAGPVKQLAVNLFYGWGYNFYRHENQLRTDDLLVRSKVSDILGTARTSVEHAESEYRRDFLPAPSRAHPYPAADAVKTAQTLERLAKGIGALASEMHSQPAPEDDFILRRLRGEAATLQDLLDRDQRLVGRAEMLRTLVAGKDGAWLASNEPAIEEGIHAIAESLRERQNSLQIP